MVERITGFFGEYRWLSNFWNATVAFDEMWFPTVENAFQASKEFVRGRRAPYQRMTPAQAKRAGRVAKLRGDWEDVKLGIMRHLVRQKFTRHEDLKRRLLATGDAYIAEENNWGDDYWGTCNGEGENNLGQIIMAVRDELRGDGS